MTNSDLAIGIVAAIALALCVGLAWERTNGYGKMCNSVFTFYTDTCPR